MAAYSGHVYSIINCPKWKLYVIINSTIWEWVFVTSGFRNECNKCNKWVLLNNSSEVFTMCLPSFRCCQCTVRCLYNVLSLVSLLSMYFLLYLQCTFIQFVSQSFASDIPMYNSLAPQCALIFPAVRLDHFLNCRITTGITGPITY